MTANNDLLRQPAWGWALALAGFVHLALVAVLFFHFTPVAVLNDTPAIALEMAPPSAPPAPVHDAPTPQQVEAPQQTPPKPPQVVKLPFDLPPMPNLGNINPEVVLPPKKQEVAPPEKSTPLPPAPTTTVQAAPEQKPDKKTTALVNNGASAGKATPSDIWDARVVARIELMKQYPGSAMRQHQEDDVGVILALNRAGQLLDAKVQGGRGFALLNQAALDAVRRAAPFPKPPADVLGDPIRISVIIRFFTPKRN